MHGKVLINVISADVNVIRHSNILKTTDACPLSPDNLLRHLLGHICILGKDTGTGVHHKTGSL